MCWSVHPTAAALATELEVPSRKLIGLKLKCYLQFTLKISENIQTPLNEKVDSHKYIMYIFY